MAEINVERKKGMGIWPWILGLVVVALLLWLLLGTGRGRDTTTGQQPVATDTGAIGAPGTPTTP